MTVPDEPQLFAALGRGTPGFQDIRDTPESEWLDFKEQPYDLSTPSGKFELAKDIAGLAEANGGVIVIGVDTRQDAVTRQEFADKLRPLPSGMIGTDQVRKILAALVYPPLDRLVAIDRFPMDDGKEIVTLRVPPQDEGSKPFLVLGTVDPSGRQRGNVFGYFKRQGDTTPPVPAQYVQSLLKDGRRFQKWIESGNPRDVLGLLQADSKLLDPTPKNEEREAQLAADMQVAGIGGEPHLFIQVWPNSRADLRGLLEQGRSGFRDAFLASEQLRPAGFNLDFSAEVQTLRAGGLRKVSQDTLAMSVLRNGLLTVLVGPRYLGWASESLGRETINPYALLEFILETCRFATNVMMPRLVPRPTSFWFEAGLRELKVDGGPRRLSPGLPMQWTSDPHVPAEDASEITTGPIEASAPERAAFALLREIYMGFGLPESAIPFADLENDAIDLTEFVNRT